MRQIHIFQSWKRRTTNDQSYELVKPLSFMNVAKEVRLKVEIMIKHIHFSTKLSILKHPVVTVVKKRRKEPNYGQIYIIIKQAKNYH